MLSPKKLSGNLAISAYQIRKVYYENVYSSEQWGYILLIGALSGSD